MFVITQGFLSRLPIVQGYGEADFLSSFIVKGTGRIGRKVVRGTTNWRSTAVTIFYQAENWTRFEDDFEDEEGDPINISSAVSVTLFLWFPTSATPTQVSGSYHSTSDHSQARADVTTITNANLSAMAISKPVPVGWQFKAVLSVGSEPIWTPRQTVLMWQNYG